MATNKKQRLRRGLASSSEKPIHLEITETYAALLKANRMRLRSRSRRVVTARMSVDQMHKNA